MQVRAEVPLVAPPVAEAPDQLDLGEAVPICQSRVAPELTGRRAPAPRLQVGGTLPPGRPRRSDQHGKGNKAATHQEA